MQQAVDEISSSGITYFKSIALTGAGEFSLVGSNFSVSSGLMSRITGGGFDEMLNFDYSVLNSARYVFSSDRHKNNAAESARVCAYLEELDFTHDIRNLFQVIIR